MKNLISLFTVFACIIISNPVIAQKDNNVTIQTLANVKTITINAYGMNIVTVPSRTSNVVIYSNFDSEIIQTNQVVNVSRPGAYIADGSSVSLDTSHTNSFLCLMGSIETNAGNDLPTLALEIPSTVQVNIIR